MPNGFTVASLESQRWRTEKHHTSSHGLPLTQLLYFTTPPLFLCQGRAAHLIAGPVVNGAGDGFPIADMIPRHKDFPLEVSLSP